MFYNTNTTWSQKVRVTADKFSAFVSVKSALVHLSLPYLDLSSIALSHQRWKNKENLKLLSSNISTDSLLMWLLILYYVATDSLLMWLLILY